jgi:hypothetical protein
MKAVSDPAAADLSRRLRSVQRALLRLGAEESLGRLVNLAPRFACQALELDRAMLLHISGNAIVSGTAWAAGDHVAASDFARFLRAAHPQLTSCPPEFEAVQRQLPILVTNAQHRDDVYRPLVHAARAEAYIVAPMIRGDRVIGLLHADRFPVIDRRLDVLDRDLLWTFATGLADLIDRAAARGLRNGSSSWVSEPEPALVEEPVMNGGAVTTAASSGPLTLLTSREHEVLALLEHKLAGRPVDVVLSDMAPNLSGVAASDAARMADLVELAIDFARRHLRPEGSLVCKVFHGSGYSQLVERFKASFRSVKAVKPKASRAKSAETFLVGRGVKPVASSNDIRA